MADDAIKIFLVISRKFVLCFLSVSFIGCFSKPPVSDEFHNATSTHPNETIVRNPPKNLILMIGDGMGPQQLALLKMFVERNEIGQRVHPNSALISLMTQGQIGIVFPQSEDALVVDSACSATQISAGVQCLSESLGLDQHGRSVSTIAERARAAGKSVGLITDTRVTHATPAAFFSHRPHRSDENGIAEDIIQSNFSLILGGGARHFTPGPFRKDNRDLFADARNAGYELVFNRAELNSSRGKRVLGVFAPSGMADGIQHHSHKNNPPRSEPTLAEMTSNALRLLERDPDGFFLMVEGGQIDWAAHHNDAGLMLHELLKFDEAVEVVRNWVKNRQDTLVVVTADHETGSFGLSYSAYDIPPPRLIPSSENDGASVFSKVPFKPKYNFPAPDVINGLYNQKQSFRSLFEKFASLGLSEQTSQRLISMVKDSTGYTLTSDEAEEILALAPNPYYVEGHEELGLKRAPVICDFAAFYPDGKYNRSALLARKLSRYQGVVWGTGTHTSTPVFVIALGKPELVSEFNGVFGMDQLGRLLLKLSFSDL